MQTKSEVKCIKRIKELGGQYKVTHTGTYDGRRTTTALIKIDGKYYEDSAQCSKQDRFDKKVGRSIALGRALVNYDEKRVISLESIPNIWRFKEDRNG